jgi:hypothetical protein
MPPLVNVSIHLSRLAVFCRSASASARARVR